ncbi:tetratricopeptide repeat protein [Flavobacteriaceae bacterium M23B6Z8]
MTKNITFIILTFLLFSCKGKNRNEYQSVDVNSQLKEVTNYQELNDFQSANKLLNTLIDENPNNAELYFRLAHSKTISNPNLFEIMNLLEECLKRDPLNYKALYLKSQGLMFMGDFKGALDTEKRILENYPNSFVLKADIASTLLFNGDFEKAIEFSESILPESQNIYEKERLIRVQIYANYFLDKIEHVKIGKDKLQELGFETNYLQKLIDSKELKFENFAVGKNVGNKPCSLNELNIMFAKKS